MSYTVEAVIPVDSPSSSGQAHVEQLQKVESELLSTKEELRGFEKHYREVRGLLDLPSHSKPALTRVRDS